MDLHGKIMNIQVRRTEDGQPIGWSPAYLDGHRDARHAAAELASAHEAAVELPDEGELEAWRSAATRLRHEARGGDGRLTAAHLLENAYLFAMKLHQQRRGELVSG